MNVLSHKRAAATREHAGLSQVQLAARLKISRRALQYCENGARKPDIDLALAWAEATSTSLDALLDFVSEKDSSPS